MGLRVLLISHTCQSPTEGQPKCWELAAIPGVELCVLVPDRWKHYGAWRRPVVPTDTPFRLVVGKTRLPWAGPAQFYLHTYPQLGALVREFKPDVIDVWEEPWGAVSVQAVRARRRFAPNAKLISETEQNLDKHLPPPFEAFRRYTLRNADHVVGRNHESIEIVRRRGFVGPTTVIPNAVDDKLFVPMDRAECRRTLGIDGFLIGYVGRLVEEKGLADLVDALPLTPPTAQAVFVGSGPFEATLRERATAKGVASRVHLLPGRSLNELPPLMNAFDVLALPSRTTQRWKEQFGRVIIEAHACGTPVIGSSSGAIPDVVGAGGLVFQEQQPDDLARAITKLMTDPGQCRALGEAGRRQVELNYTWRHVARRMHDIYRELVEQPGSSHDRKGAVPS
jgi:glycosyltransferase involved in cell wall biosynthesis